MTDSALATVSNALAQKEFSPEQVELIKRTVCKGATDDELAMFLHIAQKSGLDPFAKQIYAIKRKDFKSGGDVLTVQTSIDGYRLIAERTGKYAPGRAPEYAYKPDGALKSSTVTINKRVGDQWFEVQATAFYDEYVQRYGDKIANMWAKMPHVMLAKCAESLALRRAFPNETLGILTGEEMAQSVNEGPSRMVKMPQAKPAEISAPDSAPLTEEEIEFGEPPNHKMFEPPQEMPSDELWKKFKATVREMGLKDKVKAWCKVSYGKESSKELSAKEISEVLAMIERGAIRQ